MLLEAGADPKVVQARGRRLVGSDRCSGRGSCSSKGASVACGKAGWTLATAALAGRSPRCPGRQAYSHRRRLRWHLHELFPGLAIARRVLRVLDELDDRPVVVDSTVGLIARELVARCRELTFACLSRTDDGSPRSFQQALSACRGQLYVVPEDQPAALAAHLRDFINAAGSELTPASP